MPSAELHVVTGATGLVGSAIVLELLRARPDAQILALVRPGADGPAPRLHASLLWVAESSGLGSSLDRAILTRTRAVAGDIQEPGCGAEIGPEWAGAEVWHCAAALNFQRRYEQQVMETNVTGTRNALALAQALGARALNFVSTAYVAGTATGVIREERIADAIATHNHYEQSKRIAEDMIAGGGLPARILRPSIVIGHSETRAAITCNGLYGFIRGVYKFRRLLERTQVRLADTLELRMVADAAGTVDLIPVDFVARDAVGLSLAGADPGIYHLTGVARPATRRTIEIVFESVGLRPPRFVDDRSELTWLDRQLDQAVEIYSGYLLGSRIFDRSRADRWLARPAVAGHRLSDDELRRICAWYVDTDLAARALVAETA